MAVALFAAASSLSAQGGRVVTDTLWSQALGARKELVVYLPPSYGRDAARRYPVAYYLHGAGGNETNWVRKAGLATVMDSLVAAGMPEMIVAMPDGDDGWYTTYNVLVDLSTCRRNLPEGADPAKDCVPWPHYDDYIAYDVVAHVDGKYATRADRAHRAIAGLSMGGYGAMALALQYPRLFAAAASHSGVLWPMERAPAPFTHALERTASDSAALAARRTGKPAEQFRVIFGADSAAWIARDPLHLLDRARARHEALPALFADCGTEDFLVVENRAFRDALATRGVPLEYHEWPGAHTWPYWRDHVAQSLTWIAANVAR
ncbi:MAG: alpha/beta hydrolase fold domain-containing protein [Gemmatimonadetes bacterium]|nr:alpha/beta hydrolase fold domain-containing protein [Gemmatimonadota bacterium]MBI3504339.1 alpha/beta hydrolase fold domain-containing protein [Pseudomonadota bacterium]